MTSNLSNAEVTKEVKAKLVKNLSEYKLNDSQKNLIKNMSKNMQNYSNALRVFGSLWCMLLLIGSIINLMQEDWNSWSDKIENFFYLAFVLIQAIVFFLIFRFTRKVASSFKTIVNDERLNGLENALDNMKKLYQIQRGVVALILILIPVKIFMDLVSHVSR